MQQRSFALERSAHSRSVSSTVAKNVSNKKIFYIIPSYQKYFIFHRIIIISKYLIEYYLHNLKLLEKIIIFTCVTNITNIICIT